MYYVSVYFWKDFYTYRNAHIRISYSQSFVNLVTIYYESEMYPTEIKLFFSKYIKIQIDFIRLDFHTFEKSFRLQRKILIYS